jgi:hypothetical protein
MHVNFHEKLISQAVYLYITIEICRLYGKLKKL